jgi:dolichol-phosphate mannosyltransferase
MTDVSVILPTLDEVDALAELLPALVDEVPRIREVLVVDDGSTDGTRELVERMHEEDARIVLVKRSARPSVVGAIRHGIERARADMVGWMDADGTIDPADLSRLVDAVESGAEIAVGSRYARGGRIKGQATDGLLGRLSALPRVARSADAPMAVLGSWILNTAVLPVVLGAGRHDYTSGFVVGRREAIASLELEGEHGAYFIGLWMQARRAGIDVVEVPYAARPRAAGRSKAGSSYTDYLAHAGRYLSAAVSARRG